jgi:hypothetical protein
MLTLSRRTLRHSCLAGLFLVTGAAQAAGIDPGPIPTAGDFQAATGMKPLEKPLNIKACLFDPMGATGEVVNYGKDLVLAARKWNVFVDLHIYTDEGVATEDFKAGQCDVVAISTLRARQFNSFVGSFDSVGSLQNYDEVKTALKVLHTSSKLAPLMINGPYEIGGLVPLGAVYVMVRDRQVNSIEKAAGKRVAVLEWDKSQARMVEKLGAQPVPSDITNFGGKFNNGQVDIIAAPALAFRPLELFRGLGSKGAIFRIPLVMMTGAIVFNRDRFIKQVPDLDDRIQKIREFALGHMEQAFNVIGQVEKDIDSKYWMDLTPQDTDRYVRMMREARIQLTHEGVYDPRMMAMLKKVRCKHFPATAECSQSDE